MVEGQIILELKAVEKFHVAHLAQARHYLAATGHHLAILINFGTATLQHKRVVL